MVRLIQIEANELGGHENLTVYTDGIPDMTGWAVIPDDIEIPETFPFVNITVKKNIVTSMTAGVVPPPEPCEPESTVENILNALLGVSE